MYIYCVDDSPMHLEKIERAVKMACEDLSNLTIVRCADGQQFLDEVKNGKKPSLVTLDINMPNLDGLSTLVKFRKFSKCRVLMVSAENSVVVKRLATSMRFSEPEAKRMLMLNRVIERVVNGHEEPGKINSVLEACASLGLDPIAIARQYGATDFLQKPFEPKEAVPLIKQILATSTA